MRESWENFFIGEAFNMAKRSTCIRRNVGAIAVRDKRIVASGYNGPPPKVMHCEDRGGCYRELNNIPSGTKTEACHAIHAEQNLLVMCSRYGISIMGCDVYITHQPCYTCLKMLIGVGVKSIRYTSAYPDHRSLDLLTEIKAKDNAMQTEDYTLYIWEMV